MSESEVKHSRQYCPMKVATLKDWLLNLDEEFINMNMESSSNSTSNGANGSPPQQQNMSNFEFQKKEKQSPTADSTADELFFDGKLLPLKTVQKRSQNNNAAAIDHVRSQSLIEDNTIIISPSHSRRFSSSDANPSEYQFQFPAGLMKRSWSQRLMKQAKQSWLVQKLKASQAYIKSLFTKSERDKSYPGSANGGGAGNKPKPPEDHHGEDENVEDNAAAGDSKKGSFEKVLDETVVNTINKGLHDDGRSSSRRSSLSGVLRRHFSSRGWNPMASANSSGTSSNSSSFSLSVAGCNELKALKRSISFNAGHYMDPEKSVDEAIAHCKLSQRTGVGFGAKLMVAPKVAASANQHVATSAANTPD